MPRTIGSLGSVALLVSSITGPSMVVIPVLFQQAGWLTPLLTFVAMALLSGTAALFVVEAMSSIEGNEAFQASIEFTTIAHLFLGRRWHFVVQGLLYLAMQTLVIASLLESFQGMDAFLIAVAHKTCAISFTNGYICVNQIPPNAGSAFPGHILGSFGTLITICLILPLSLVHLVDNIIFQVASFITLLIITIIWIVIFIVSGLNTNHIPVVGHNQSTVVGFVLSNFSFVTTVPAWVNNTHPSVNIRLVVWTSVLISCLIYILIGWMGGSAFIFPSGATLLQVFATRTGHATTGTIARVSSYVFPLAVLITSIPVFTIVIRYNLLRDNICSYRMAIFWSAIAPWLIAIPFQTNNGLTIILNWASLIFTSPSNLLVPFILFILSKRHLASAVLDANVSYRVPRDPEVGTPLAPSGLTTAPDQVRQQDVTPAENIPVVVITDSTMTCGAPGEAKTLASQKSPEMGRSSLDTIPMPIRNRVLSPSRHRYYGQKVLIDGDHNMTGEAVAEAHRPRRPSLSPSLPPHYSISHPSSPGMDEFLLMNCRLPEPPSHDAPAALGTQSPRPSMSTGVVSLNVTIPSASSTVGELYPSAGSDPPRDADVRLSMSTLAVGIETPAPTFKAFPGLSPTSLIRSTRISAVGCFLATALVLTAIVYDIVQSA